MLLTPDRRRPTGIAAPRPGAGDADASSSRSATTRRSSSGDGTGLRRPHRASWTRLAEMLEEVLAVGERALIFTQFAEMGGLLQDVPAGRPAACEVLFLHGGTPAKQRDRDGRALPGQPDGAADLHAVAQGRRHRPEPDRAPTMSSTSTAGGTPPSRTRPPTAPSASARPATCRCTSSCAPARWRTKIDD